MPWKPARCWPRDAPRGCLDAETPPRRRAVSSGRDAAALPGGRGVVGDRRRHFRRGNRYEGRRHLPVHRGNRYGGRRHLPVHRGNRCGRSATAPPPPGNRYGGTSTDGTLHDREGWRRRHPHALHRERGAGGAALLFPPSEQVQGLSDSRAPGAGNLRRRKAPHP
ncbi:Hypothetical protein CAP_8641 [Chondromyces apiculatus DSM 436]|uniref:Uncharacterized protein n=1 Tax=Chondromyces apiculatus DSM 436 TaxID=1192034 RepID=A0A017SXX3_9BACT|nr:Hypothetical protein CAP_8641 [Chondromyces apiculatus DSM 436]